MATNIINGSSSAGRFIAKADDNVLTIMAGMDAVNNTETVKKVKGVDAIKPFIKEVFGLNGHTEIFSNYQIFAYEDGEFADGIVSNETYESWFLTRRSLRIKDKDFSLKLIEDAYEASLPLGPIVQERVKGISQWYLQKYLPCVIYEALCVIPTGTDAATYRAAPKGFLHQTVVPIEMLKPGVTNTTREHFLGVDSASGGCTFEDLEAVVEMMSEYIDTSDSNIIGYATRATLAKLKSTLAFDGNIDIFARTGLPTETIAGIQFMVNDYVPKNKILFLNGDANAIITRLQSPKTDRRNLAIEKPTGFTSMETINDFIGSYYKVMPEGYFVTGRHNGCWLDIGSDSTTGASGGPMSSSGLLEITNHAKTLKATYAKSLV